MSLIRTASWIHKWLALIVGVQIPFWLASGVFFAVFPVERVRSEHRIAMHEPVPLDRAALASAAELPTLMPEQPLRVSFERAVTGEPVAIAEFAERAPVLIDLAQGAIVSPISAETAQRIAQTYVADAPDVRAVESVTESSPEYRGPLPAWRVSFADAEGLAVYVAADTGRVGARRSDLWRAFDAMWALHIMDWRDRENFNHGLMILASVLSLVVVLSGFILIPYRLGWLRRRAR